MFYYFIPYTQSPYGTSLAPTNVDRIYDDDFIPIYDDDGKPVYTDD